MTKSELRRQIAGGVAVAIPFALVIHWWVLPPIIGTGIGLWLAIRKRGGLREG